MSTAAILPPPASSAGVLAAVARVEADVQLLRAVLAGDPGLTGLTDSQAADAAVALAHAAETVQAGALAGLGRVADSGYPAQEGYVTAASWWRAKTRVSSLSARGQLRQARRLARRFPATADAWRGRVVTGEHAETITRGVEVVLRRLTRAERARCETTGEPFVPVAWSRRLDEHRTELEATLLELAVSWPPETIVQAAAVAINAADPDGADQDTMDAACSAKLLTRTVGDAAVTTLDHTLESAAKLRTVLDHFRTLAHATGQATPAESGELDPVTGDPITVSQGQRDAQAFDAWLDATLDGGLGSGNQSERAHLDVIATLEDLAKGTGSAVIGRLGAPSPISTAARVACDADVRVVLVDGQYRDPHTGERLDPAVAGILIAGAGILDYGRAHRIIPTRLRRALTLRDRGCAFPGCHRRPQHTQAHHVIHWLHGGKTSLDNTVLLCSRHHHYVHEGGWTITARAGISYNQPGYWQFDPPERVGSSLSRPTQL